MTRGASVGTLDGRVVVVTGAGRGIGREHALLMASEGARVVVNDLGTAADGVAAPDSPAARVVEEIRDAGGQAVPDGNDAADAEGARRIVASALRHFGRLDGLVNNAGFLRDRTLVNMSDEDWDSVIRVHLRGVFCPTRAAAAYWRDQAKSGEKVSASVVNTSSGAGLTPMAGQANYAAAKAGVAAFTQVCAQELPRYGARANAIAPAARTRLTAEVPGPVGEAVRPPEDASAFDVYDPANVAPLVAYLVTEDCPVNGRVFWVRGGEVLAYRPWELGSGLERADRWTVDELAKELPQVCE